MTQLNIKLIDNKLQLSNNIPFPSYKTEGASGIDIYSNWTFKWWNNLAHEFKVDGQQYIHIPPKATIQIPTNVSVEIPCNMEGQLRLRSSMAFKHNLCIPNGIGTIDSDYRGELFGIVHNLSQAEAYSLKIGERVFQLIITSFVRCNLHFTDNISATDRGAGGFGSTGKF